MEALFSPRKVWGDESFRPLIESMRVTGPDVFAKYERTIRKFAYGDFQRRRHACRLSLDLAGLRHSGRFDPVMTGAATLLATKYAERFEGDALIEHLFAKE